MNFWGRQASNNPALGFRRTLLALAVLATLLAMCSSGQPAPVTITATPDLLRNPLTGLPVDDPAIFNRRPLAAKISNAPDSVRPQAGVAAADLVFEHYVEGRLTRFTAIFWTHAPPRIGSIRSARLIDLEIPAMYGALLVYSGASEPIRQRIAESAFAARAYEGVTTGAPLYFRDPGIDVPHNLFAVPAEVWARASADGFTVAPPLSAMVFAPAPPAAAAPATQVSIDYGPDLVTWAYDEASGRYARVVDGEPHRDANTHAPVTAANIVILYAQHREDLSIVEGEWNGTTFYSIEIQLWGRGPATIIRDGVAANGFWARQGHDTPLTFWADEDATIPIPLKPGTTWFEIVPLDFSGVRIG